MKNDPLPAWAYIGHIREAAIEVGSFIDGLTFAEFAASRLVQLATTKLIENIGEASRRLSRDHPDVIRATPAVPWAAMIAMRNRLSHAYENIKLETVWHVAHVELPALVGVLPDLSDHAATS